MAINNINQINQATDLYAAQQAKSAQESAKTAKANYGATLGKPQLSEAGAKYYEELKNKFKDMDFVLVSKDMIDVAKNNASSYGNKNRMVVLIDEEKIEKMASDDAFRQQYEGLISTAQSKMPVLQQMMANNPNVKTIGMQVGNDGRASFFAVMDKSAKDMQARIEEKRAAKKEAAKAEAKKEAKAKQKERIEEARAEKAEARKKLEGDEEEDYDILMADSIEDLLGMIEEWNGNFREATPEDALVGQNFDFSA